MSFGILEVQRCRKGVKARTLISCLAHTPTETQHKHRHSHSHTHCTWDADLYPSVSNACRVQKEALWVCRAPLSFHQIYRTSQESSGHMVFVKGWLSFLLWQLTFYVLEATQQSETHPSPSITLGSGWSISSRDVVMLVLSTDRLGDLGFIKTY